jgi:4-hydroxy-tetrahydrodipicolinate reductase
MTRVAVTGATGQMGRTVVETAADRDDVAVVCGVDVETEAVQDVPVHDPERLGETLAEYDVDAVIDFSVPASTVEVARTCADAGVALVTGTTGLEENELSIVQEASDAVPVLRATNFSRGIQALQRALGEALAALPEYDVELQETHHNRKRDAPSGTARTILETIASERDLDPVYGREGIQPREDEEVGVLVSRLGDVRGEHEVRLGDNDEVLTIAHRAEDRAVFAAGALDAAAWLAGRNPGWYTFGEVIDAQ